jgi:hypothetical protein
MSSRDDQHVDQDHDRRRHGAALAERAERAARAERARSLLLDLLALAGEAARRRRWRCRCWAAGVLARQDGAPRGIVSTHRQGERLIHDGKHEGTEEEQARPAPRRGAGLR